MLLLALLRRPIRSYSLSRVNRCRGLQARTAREPAQPIVFVCVLRPGAVALVRTAHSPRFAPSRSAPLPGICLPGHALLGRCQAGASSRNPGRVGAVHPCAARPGVDIEVALGAPLPGALEPIEAERGRSPSQTARVRGRRSRPAPMHASVPGSTPAAHSTTKGSSPRRLASFAACSCSLRSMRPVTAKGADWVTVIRPGAAPILPAWAKAQQPMTSRRFSNILPFPRGSGRPHVLYRSIWGGRSLIQTAPTRWTLAPARASDRADANSPLQRGLQRRAAGSVCALRCGGRTTRCRCKLSRCLCVLRSTPTIARAHRRSRDTSEEIALDCSAPSTDTVRRAMGARKRSVVREVDGRARRRVPRPCRGIGRVRAA